MIVGAKRGGAMVGNRRPHGAALALLLGALAATPARAMLEPCAYDDMVRMADTVVQIEGITVAHGADQPETCVISGTVATVLSGALAVGDRVTVTVHCEWDGMIGAAIYHDRAALTGAELIELHLVAGEVAAYGAGLDVVDPARRGQPSHDWNCD